MQTQTCTRIIHPINQRTHTPPTTHTSHHTQTHSRRSCTHTHTHNNNKTTTTKTQSKKNDEMMIIRCLCLAPTHNNMRSEENQKKNCGEQRIPAKKEQAKRNMHLKPHKAIIYRLFLHKKHRPGFVETNRLSPIFALGPAARSTAQTTALLLHYCGSFQLIITSSSTLKLSPAHFPFQLCCVVSHSELLCDIILLRAVFFDFY